MDQMIQIPFELPDHEPSQCWHAADFLAEPWDLVLNGKVLPEGRGGLAVPRWRPVSVCVCVCKLACRGVEWIWKPP